MADDTPEQRMVDFDNLSPRELGLLLYALKPAEGFRHKLGMGKPIGLGGVRAGSGVSAWPRRFSNPAAC